MSNIKAPSVEIEPFQVAAVIDWMNRTNANFYRPSMSRDEVQQLVRGDSLIMHEATMGEGNDGIERIYAPGTPAIFWMLERLGSPHGLAATLIIGPQDDDTAIVNCFYECDPAGYPFRRCEDSRG
ncbi:hypothetical protein [Sphingobium yanoikuyae]|uniref:hypothetical protein n=1 Tax=Sphingobium yanoikuyae TaxID=13690 RepID=UPI00241F8CC0|nr:hypothetical protein [Sphingobium yanoikuyae]